MRTYRIQKHHGFTLVELLVVMAIISILAGLLLPVLATSVSAARMITCTNNEKQLWQAFQFYEESFGGYLALPEWYTVGTPSSPGSWSGTWVWWLYPRCEYFHEVKRCYFCPSYVQNIESPPDAWTWEHHSNYGLSSAIKGGYTVQRTGALHLWMKLRDWENKASRCLKFACHDRDYVNYYAPNWNDLKPQHKQKELSVIMFFDGHAETRTFAEVYADQPGAYGAGPLWR